MQQRPEGKQPRVPSQHQKEGQAPKACALALGRLLSLSPALISAPSCKHVSCQQVLGAEGRKEQLLEADPRTQNAEWAPSIPGLPPCPLSHPFPGDTALSGAAPPPSVGPPRGHQAGALCVTRLLSRSRPSQHLRHGQLETITVSVNIAAPNGLKTKGDDE